MDRIDSAQLGQTPTTARAVPAAGPLRVAPMANPPAAEIARQRAAARGSGTDSIDFSAAARRLAEARRADRPGAAMVPGADAAAAAAAAAAAGRLVGARVAGPAFEAPQRLARAADAPLPFYRDPALANAAATAVAGSRLDVTG